MDAVEEKLNQTIMQLSLRYQQMSDVELIRLASCDPSDFEPDACSALAEEIGIRGLTPSVPLFLDRLLRDELSHEKDQEPPNSDQKLKTSVFAVVAVAVPHAVVTYVLFVTAVAVFLGGLVGAESSWMNYFISIAAIVMTIPLIPIVQLIPGWADGMLLTPFGTVVILINSTIWAIGITSAWRYFRSKQAA